jgi:6,7-dimethyl-8-ribityllumazine synthase
VTASSGRRRSAGGVPDRYAIAAATFYEELAAKLIDGARRVFEDAGHDVDVFEVPGAFELPMAAKICAQTGRYSGVACVGAVIRGETTHYDYVCTESARGIQDVQLETGVPCGFGVLTVESYEQALARVGDKRHQGEDAARAVLALAKLRAEIA